MLKPPRFHRSRATLVVALAAVLASACSGKSRFDGVVFDPPEPAPPVALTQVNGTPFNFARQEGNIVVVFFGYTHCPDVCPTTLSDWVKVKRALGNAASHVRFVFISVDPGRDTPASTQAYVMKFDSAFVGLTGDSAAVAQVQHAFHVTSSREYVKSSNDYGVMHSGQAFVIDQHQKVRLLYPPGSPSKFMVGDLKRLLHGA